MEMKVDLIVNGREEFFDLKVKGKADWVDLDYKTDLSFVKELEVRIERLEDTIKDIV